MSFLKAHATLKSFAGGPPLHVLLAMSGAGESLELYVRAAAAEIGLDANVRLLPFGTLSQSLLGEADGRFTEVFLLFPWDFMRELDWRTGVAADGPDSNALFDQANEVARNLAARRAAIVYVDAECAPLGLDPSQNASVRSHLRSLAEGLGASVLPGTVFSLSGYLNSGQPVATKDVDAVAREVVRLASLDDPKSAKVLITDLDHTLWHGIIGDEGIEGIHYRPEGKGFRHFIFQTLLRRLKNNGVLLAAVSKNDEEIAREPFRRGQMVLQESDFVAVVASWQPKSTQIQMLAEQLNLGLDAFVFVDDNPVELAEVSARLPQVSCVEFPRSEQGIAALVVTLVKHFRRSAVTQEDRERTAMYRRRFETLPPRQGSAADIHEFLTGLEMTLVVEERTSGDRTRAIQLINKTNQFNINGRRLDDSLVAQQLQSGSRLFTASLTDRSGDHGQILAALLSPEGTITSLVMSCRVFQRRVEYAFLGWLTTLPIHNLALDFQATERNTPVQGFLMECAGEVPSDGIISLPLDTIKEKFARDMALFRLLDQVTAP